MEVVVADRNSLRVLKPVDWGASLCLIGGLHSRVLFRRSTAQTLPVEFHILVHNHSKGNPFDCDLRGQSWAVNMNCCKGREI